MSLIDTPLTKASLLEQRDQLAVARNGHDLLEEKREVLASELLNIIDDAEELRKTVNEKLEAAYGMLIQAVQLLGAEQVERTALACHAEARIDLTERMVMGVPLPLLKRKMLKLEPQYGLLGTVYSLDEALRRFHGVLESILQLAETERTAWHLAIELKKTQRRVNALENIIIPQYEETIHFIEERLEEVERETVFQMKLLKSKKRGRRDRSLQ